MQKGLTVTIFVQLTIFCSVEAVSMSVTPSSMVVGSANSVTRLELRCSSDGTNNNGIYGLEIARRRFTGIDYTGLALADILEGVKQDPNMPADIVAKSPNITGGLTGTSGTLILTMDGSSITCNDQAEFRCLMTYKVAGISGSHTASETTNFTVITVPSDFRITDALYEDKGIQLQLTNDSRLAVGTRITYRCSANIGSDSSLAIAWERSSMLGASTEFTTYTPTVSTDIVQDPVVQVSCSYTRTSTMYYNMTSMDDDGILFRCKVRSYVGNQWYEPTSMPRRTFTNSHLSSSSSPDTNYSNTVSTTATSYAVNIDRKEGSHVNISEVMAITLGVLFGASIVLIVILSICLHIYRKLAVELKYRPQSRPQMYDGLNETVESSAPYSVLNREPRDNHQQSDYLNAYDRLNRTVGHSKPYDMLERDNADQRVPEESKPYVYMEHNVL